MGGSSGLSRGGPSAQGGTAMGPWSCCHGCVERMLDREVGSFVGKQNCLRGRRTNTVLGSFCCCV